jgi:outer membrane protein, multidrug efflux system
MTSPHACQGRAAFAAAMWGAAALLAGCAVPAPPPAIAPVSLPAQWTEPVPAGTRALAQWWHVFGDATLADLVEAALRSNTDIASAQANLRAARAARAEAAAGLWPTLTATVGAQRTLGAQRVAPGNLFDVQLDAAWEADVFGATRHGVAAQEALERSSAATLAAVQVSVAAEVALAYLDLRSAQERAAVARENLASQEETLQISRWRQQAGLATSVEVEQAVTAVEQTRAQVPTLRSAAATAAHALAVLAGDVPAAVAGRLAVPAHLPQPAGDLAVGIPAAALRQRPDILAAEQQLRAAAEQVAQADAQRLPAASIAASLAWSGTTLGAVGSAVAARSLLASVQQPLFDAGLRNARLAGRQAQFDAAQAGYRASVLKALQEVEDALAALDAARERTATLRRALEAARNAALLATQRHASGLIDFQVVLETQRTLLSVQDSLVAGQAELAADHVRLYKALGGGWRRAGEEEPA